MTEHYEPYGLKLMPQAVVVGESVDNITSCYVRVNGVNYVVDNPLKAVDITFKIIHALDSEYPKEIRREWFFLERCIYKMNAGKRSTLATATSSIRTDFEKFLTAE